LIAGNTELYCCSMSVTLLLNATRFRHATPFCATAASHAARTSPR